MAKKNLTEKQRMFAEEYLKNGGNIFKACLSAGYTPAYAQGKGYLLLENDLVKDYMAKLTKKTDKSKIKSIEEVQEFWSNIMDNSDEKIADRLRASENIAKVYGAFITKNETTLQGAIDVNDTTGLEELDDEELEKILEKIDID